MRWMKTLGDAAQGLAAFAALLGLAIGQAEPARSGELEKDTLKFGFIKLTDMAPLAIAKEKFFFEDEGLQVQLESQANWKVLLDRVITGELDGAHMLAGQPLAATIGYGTKADLVTAFSMDLNGNAITVSNAVFEEMKPHLERNADGKPKHPISAASLKPVVERYRDDGLPFNMGMVFPVSSHNYELRYWLAAGGLRPGFYSPTNTAGQIQADVLLSVTPPPQMPATIEAGTILGYCVGEPWNQAAVFKGIGVPVITNHGIWKFNPEKVFAVSDKWAKQNPNTHIAVVKALIRAGKWLDDPANREEAVKILSHWAYVGADEEVIAASMTGSFEFEKGDTRPAPDFNVFFNHYATYPYYSDAIWTLTQMRRWGQIDNAKSDDWYFDVAKKVYRPGIYMQAAEALIADGHATKDDFPFGTDGFKAPTAEFIDGIEYDGKKPTEYLSKFPIGLKDAQTVAGNEVLGG